MKKILVPCDFSVPATEALKFAARLARQNKAELVAVHALELPVLYDSSAVLAFEQDYMVNEKEKAQKKLMKLLERWGTGVRKMAGFAEFGGVVPVVERVIKTTDADLVIMGTHGASGLKEYTIGSNAERIVRNSEAAVIVVKKPVKEIKEIVFPVYPKGDQEEITMKVKELQELFKARLHVLFVNTPGMFHRDMDIRPLLEAFAERYMLKNYTLNIFSDTDEVEGIIHFTNNLTSPLVAMKTRGRLGLTHLASGSIAEDVVNHINCPIWTYRSR